MNSNGPIPDLNTRIEALIAELAMIDRELQARSAANSNGRAPALTPELLDRFKGAVDRIRLRVWAYMDTRYPGLGKNMQHVLQQRRMERAAELLIALREEAYTQGLAGGKEADALTEQIRAFHELLFSDARRQS